MAFTINRIKPAHIVYVNTPFIRSGLLLSEQIERLIRTYNYKLGSWALGQLPFATDGENEVVKLPETPSIQQALLTGVADFVSGDVASARINGTISITDLTKSVSGNILTITYTVAAAQTAEITSVELLDGAGNVLTSSQVYVPVGDSVVMKHTIPVNEGVITNG